MVSRLNYYFLEIIGHLPNLADADQPVSDLPISRSRLTDILSGVRTNDHVTDVEMHKRQVEGKILLNKVFGVSTLTV